MKTHQKHQDRSSPSLMSDLNTVEIITVKPRTEEDVITPPYIWLLDQVSSSIRLHTHCTRTHYTPSDVMQGGGGISLTSICTNPCCETPQSLVRRMNVGKLILRSRNKPAAAVWSAVISVWELFVPSWVLSVLLGSGSAYLMWPKASVLLIILENRISKWSPCRSGKYLFLMTLWPPVCLLFTWEWHSPDDD